MNILFVTPNFPYPPSRDGLSLIAYYILKHLAQKHQLKLLTFKDSENIPIREISKFGITLELIDFKPKYPSLIRYYLSGSRIPWNIARYFSSELAHLLAKEISSQKLDLVYFHGESLAIYLPLIKEKPVVLGALDAISDWYIQMSLKEKNLFKKIHFIFEAQKTKKIEKNFYPKAQACIALSKRDKDILQVSSKKSNFYIIPNGVDINYFRANYENTNSTLSVIFTGIMSYSPNIEAVSWFAKKVWPKIKKEFPRIKWYIVGKSPIKKIIKLGLKDEQIIVTGEVKNIRPYLENATIYISPMQSGTGIKNKVLEAMASKKAIVATSKSLPGIEAQDRKHLLVADLPSSFEKAIIFLLKNPSLGQELGLKARKLIEEKYTWQKVVKKYEDMFFEVISNYKAP